MGAELVLRKNKAFVFIKPHAVTDARIPLPCFSHMLVLVNLTLVRQLSLARTHLLRSLDVCLGVCLGACRLQLSCHRGVGLSYHLALI